MPSGIVATGLPAVERTCAKLGIGLDAWQLGTLRCILTKAADGDYAADTVALSIPRQVGKTYLIGALVFADCIINQGTTTAWTAHRFKVARESFDVMRAWAKLPSLAPHIDYDAITTAAGNEQIPFRNGSRIIFAARERGAVRGIAKMRRIVLDEAQILTGTAMSDFSPTQNQAHNPQMILMGTPPKPGDPGEVFTSMRAEALAGESDGTVYIEFSADSDCDIDDRHAWSQANPSFPSRTPVKAMLRMRKQLETDDDFRREALGIWELARGKRVLPDQAWNDQADPHSLAVDRMALGIEVGPDMAWASVALAGQRPDGDWHIELDDDQHTRGRGITWLAPSVQALVDGNPQIRAVVVDVGGPVAPLLEQKHGRWLLKGTTVEVTPLKVAELGSACSMVLDGTVTGWLHHIGQPQLTTAALSAGKRALGDTGKWVWSRKTATSDITPIQAATYALHGAQSSTVKKPARSSGRSGSGRRAVVL